MELARVAHNPARRKAIFADMPSHSSTEPLIVELWTELLLRLGRNYQLLSSRGGSRLTAAMASAPAQSVQDSHAIPIKSGDILRPAVRQRSRFSAILQNLLDGPARMQPPVAVAVQRIELTAKELKPKTVEQVWSLGTGVVGRLEATPSGKAFVDEGRIAVESVEGWVQSLYTLTGTEWAEQSVGRSRPDPEKMEWIIDSEWPGEAH